MNKYVEIPTNYKTEKQFKDINEWYINRGKENFKEALEESITDNFKKKTNAYYISEYIDDLNRFKNYPIKKTGFKTLDKHLDGGIRQGLYVLGAIPSLGKTTLALQIADNIAKEHKVIIFSLEQSRFELVSKSISRLTWEKSPRKRKKP